MKTFLPRLCVSGILATALIATAAASETSTHSKFTGEYYSHAYRDGSDGPSVNLSLGKDGTATVTEDYGKGLETHFGHWTETNNQVTVSFDTTETEMNEPAMVFQLGREGLQPVSWNHAAWGTVNPPSVRKSSYKVKQACWNAINPN